MAEAKSQGKVRMEGKDYVVQEGDVLVEVSHSSVNYKDGLAITGKAPVVRRFPLVPGIGGPIQSLIGTVADVAWNLTAHADQKAASDRTYLTSWAVAGHLMIAKRVIGGEAFVTYLKSVNSGGDPVTLSFGRGLSR